MRSYTAFLTSNAFLSVTKASQIEPVLRELSPGLIFWTISRLLRISTRDKTQPDWIGSQRTITRAHILDYLYAFSPVTKASQIESVHRELSPGFIFWTISTHFHPWQKPARLNRFSESYHLGSYFGLSLRIFTHDKSQPDWIGSQRAITRVHILDYLYAFSPVTKASQIESVLRELFPRFIFWTISTHFHPWQKPDRLNRFSENYHPGSYFGLFHGYYAFSPPWQKPARLNRFSENYYPGSCFGLSLRIFTRDKSQPDWIGSQTTITRVHILTISTHFHRDKSQPDWIGSQRTITRAHILDYLYAFSPMTKASQIESGLRELSPGFIFWTISTHFHPWQKPARLNRFSENYYPGSYFGLSLRIFTHDKSQPDWIGSQRTITRVHILDYLYAFSPVTKASQIESVLRELLPGLIFWTISTHFHPWQKPARLNRFSENYHLGSYFGLSLGYYAFSPVTKASQIESVLRELSPGFIFWTISWLLRIFTRDKSQPDWIGSQRTITRAHILDDLTVTWITLQQFL